MKKRHLLRWIILGAAFVGAGAAFSACQKEEDNQLEILSAVNAVGPALSDFEKELLYNSDIYYDMLSYKQKQVYIELLRACRDYKKSVEMEHVVDTNDLFTACYALDHDHPEFFWATDYVAYQTDGMVSSLEYGFEGDIQAEAEKVYSAADQIIAGMDEGISDHDKIKYIFDAVTSQTDYEENEYDQDMRSVALDKASVCAGYSRAFQYLAKKSGIDCAYVEGVAYNFNGEEEEPHAWNIVKLGDDHYWVDVTWGDTQPDESGYTAPISYAYFLVDDNELFKTHSLDTKVYGESRDDMIHEFYMPKCGDPSLDYYKSTGKYFSDYTRASASDYIGTYISNGDTDFIEMKFADHDDYLSALYDLVGGDDPYVYTIIERMEGAKASFDAQVSYIQDDALNILSIIIE